MTSGDACKASWRSWSRALGCTASGVVLMLVGGCGGSPPPAKPSAEGPMIIRHWDLDGQHPTVLVAAAAIADAELRNVQMSDITARMPLLAQGQVRGWVLITAPTGQVRSAGKGDQSPDVVLNGPLALSGSIDDGPFAGRASTAKLGAKRDGIEFSDLELVQIPGLDRRSQFIRAPSYRIRRDRTQEPIDLPAEMNLSDPPPELLTRALSLPRGYIPADPAVALVSATAARSKLR